MLPSNPAAAAANDDDVNDDDAMNGGVYSTLNGVSDDVQYSAADDEVIVTPAQSCYTPVTDPDSIALLATMHEANRFVFIYRHLHEHDQQRFTM